MSARLHPLKASVRGALRRLRAVKLARRFIRRDDGTTTVEFAIVAVPFLGLLFAIIETAIVFFAGQVLETATANSARLIMTGQAQTQGFSQTAFKESVCTRILGLFDCTNGIHVDVKSYNNFASVNLTNPVDANGNLINNFSYAPGGPGDIVVVRLIYQWPVLVPLFGLNLADMSGNRRLLISTAAFRNEPYQ